MKKALTLLVFLASIQTSSAQNVKDSVLFYLNTKPNVFIAFHNRNLVLLGESTKLYGVIGGVDYSGKVKTYLGLYGLSQQRPVTLENDSRFPSDTVIRRFSTNNISVGMSYTFYQIGRLSLSVPVQIGIGGQQVTYSDRSSILLDESNLYLPLESGVNAFFEVHRYIGIKGGVGYRLNLGKKATLDNSSPYYNLGVALLIGRMYRDIVGKD